MTESGCKLCLKKGWGCKVLLTATSEEPLMMPRCCVLRDELVLRPLSLAEVRLRACLRGAGAATAQAWSCLTGAVGWVGQQHRAQACARGGNANEPQ